MEHLWYAVGLLIAGKERSMTSLKTHMKFCLGFTGVAGKLN